MSTESIKAMHQRFLEEIQEKIVALRDELRTLQAVEQYHSQQLEALDSGEPSAPETGKSDMILPRRLARRLRNAKKKDAATIALEHLGRPAKIGEMIDLLWENGYATDMERRILHNTLYTGMTRRDDIFVKLDDGLWDLESRRDQNTEGEPSEE